MIDHTQFLLFVNIVSVEFHIFKTCWNSPAERHKHTDANRRRNKTLPLVRVVVDGDVMTLAACDWTTCGHVTLRGVQRTAV